MRMATSSGTRMAGRRGRSLLERDGGVDSVGRDVWVGSLALDGVGVGDPDDRPMTKGDENDCDTLAVDGMVPRGPAPVWRGSRVCSEDV